MTFPTDNGSKSQGGEHSTHSVHSIYTRGPTCTQKMAYRTHIHKVYTGTAKAQN